MDQEQKGMKIKRQIDALNESRQSSFNISNVDIFVLDDNAVRYFEKLEELQSQCPHKFEDNICIYCYTDKRLI